MNGVAEISLSKAAHQRRFDALNRRLREALAEARDLREMLSRYQAVVDKYKTIVERRQHG
jgi:hypothetical protein